MLSTPKHLGGWGFKNLNFFGCALAMKSLWRAIIDSGLWNKLMCVKYLQNKSFKEWFQSGFALKNFTGSFTWKGVLMTLPWVVDGLIWKVDNANDIILGESTLLGGPLAHHLSLELITTLLSKGIINLSQASVGGNKNLLPDKWKIAFDLEREPSTWKREV